MRKISMSKIKEVLRLKYLNLLSNRQIQSITGVSRNSVANYIKSFVELGSSLEEVLVLNDTDLKQLFHANKLAPQVKLTSSHKHPNWSNIREELTKKGMTRALLHEELKASQPDLYSYSQFNRYYSRYIQSINPSMRQIHYAGDKLFTTLNTICVELTWACAKFANKIIISAIACI